MDDEPGVTRDRKAADAEWEGVPFTIMDTGGYIPKGKDDIEAGVTRQVRAAMEEADAVIFLVDRTTGITDIDGDVARMLRKGDKECILVVNKVDSAKHEIDAAEFYRLGLGDPVLVSALQGRGVGDLLSRVVHGLGDPQSDNDVEEMEDDGAIRLAIVGKPNVGKSTFINAILGEERLLVTEIPGTTRDPVDVRVRYGDTEFILVDTAGMRRRTRVKESVEYYSALRTHRVVERCDVACVFVDAGEGLTQQDMRVIREVVEARKGVFVVVNKWDLVEDDEELIDEWKEDLAYRLQGVSFIPALFISCHRGLHVEDVLAWARRVAQEREKRVSSPDLNRLIESLNAKTQHPAVKGKRVRILYGAQTGIKPPKFTFFSNFPDLMQESYKRYLENQIREKFGFSGVPLSFLFKKK